MSPPAVIRLLITELNHTLGYTVFGGITAARQLFDDTPVLVAGGEVHIDIGTRRIRLQNSLNPAQGFDKVTPIIGT